jgi:caffeoyl-CoA O-methyltransferase
MSENTIDLPITEPRIEEYLTRLMHRDDPLLDEMERYAKEVGFPIVGPLVGRLLWVLARLKRARLIVELGSGYGYSAYWFAQALEPDGHIVLTDRKAENLERARRTFHEAGMEGLAEFRQGEALEIAKDYKDIDILFIDADKTQYPEAVRMFKDALVPGGLVVADNSLWHGRVASGDTTPDTRAVLAFNEMMMEDPAFFSTIVPVRDGVLVAYKL